MSAQEEQLRKIAEFDHPFVVGEDGSVTDAQGVHAPEVYHDDEHDITIGGAPMRESRMWEALVGYTGQYGYNGAVLHSSEFLGGGLAKDILGTPGTYVCVSVEVLPHVAFPHQWSESGARCTECGLIGNGTDNGSCPAHPDYDEESTYEDDENPTPAGWCVLRMKEDD